MASVPITRRCFLTISAAFSACAALPVQSASATSWNGFALGAEVSIQLHGSPDDTQTALAAARDTIRRMEKLFSLYDPQSILSRINQSGEIPMPPEFARLVGEIGKVHAATDGLFDPTIQPVFAAMLKHGGDLTDDQLRSLSDAVGWNKVEINGDTIRLPYSGMAMTLNGIAQGFATDRVTETLKAHGYENIVINIGEYRVGSDAATIGVANPEGQIIARLDVKEQAIATSSPFEFQFEDGMPQMISPVTGKAASTWQTVSVMAPTATMADGLSTALCLAESPETAKRLVKKGHATWVMLESKAGDLFELGRRNSL